MLKFTNYSQNHVKKENESVKRELYNLVELATTRSH